MTFDSNILAQQLINKSRWKQQDMTLAVQLLKEQKAKDEFLKQIEYRYYDQEYQKDFDEMEELVAKETWDIPNDVYRGIRLTTDANPGLMGKNNLYKYKTLQNRLESYRDRCTELNICDFYKFKLPKKQSGFKFIELLIPLMYLLIFIQSLIIIISHHKQPIFFDIQVFRAAYISLIGSGLIIIAIIFKQRLPVSLLSMLLLYTTGLVIGTCKTISENPDKTIYVISIILLVILITIFVWFNKWILQKRK